MQDSFVPENIHLQSIYVQRVVKGERYDKFIEVWSLWYSCFSQEVLCACDVSSSYHLTETDNSEKRTRIDQAYS